MAPKKQRAKVQFTETEDVKKMSPEVKASEQDDVQQEIEHHPEMSESAQGTVTSSESTKKRYGAARGVSAMYKVVVRKAMGKKSKVRCNSLGVPIGHNRHVFQSYIGMLARTMIPINHSNWTIVDAELKEKLWLDIQDTFKVPKELRKDVMKSAAAKWRQFKANLTKDYVKPNLGHKKKLRKPPTQYAFVGKEAWKEFVAERTTDKWQELSEKQSSRVKNRKYHHRTSRKGYIGLMEEEEKAGNLKPGEIPDRAILWKKARKPKDENTVIDGELAKINEKIDVLLEKQCKGEFKPCGSDDVLSKALQTPEHSGRVRGVGSFVTPTVYFNLAKGSRCRITKAELLSRDRQRDAELEKAKLEMSAEIEKTKQEMAELKAMIKSNNASPMLSDKASCQKNQVQETKSKPSAAKYLVPLMADDVECIDDPKPSEKKGPRKCELSVDSIDNKVAFGLIFDEDEMNNTVHGVPLLSGYARVSVDGLIRGDALVPVPVPGEIETVDQAVGAHLTWPRDLISFPNTVTDAGKKRKEKEPKNELQKVQLEFKKVEIKKNVPDRFRLLYKHALTFMKSTGTSIQILCDASVFGLEKLVYILAENIIALCEFDMIGQAAISAYIVYLHALAGDEIKEVFGFCDPGLTYNLSNTDFEGQVIKRLKEGNPDRMFIMPLNIGCHWILILISPGEIFILNSLPRSKTLPDLEKVLSRAVVSFNCQTGRGNRAPSVKYLLGCPKQPGGFECGYVVMRYMLEITADLELSFLKKWAAKSRVVYTEKEIDEVRFQTLRQIESYI